MNTLDIILLLPLVYGLVRGLFRGLVAELVGIVAIVAAIVCTRLFAPKCAIWLMQHVSLSEQVCEIIAYLLVFFVVLLVLKLVGVLVTKLLKAVSLGWLNLLLGAVFGTVKWALIVSVILNGVLLVDQYLPFFKPEWKENSATFEPLRKIASVAWDEVKTLDIKPENLNLNESIPLIGQ